MDISPGAPQSHGGAKALAATSSSDDPASDDPASSDPDDATVSDTTNGASDQDLPTRPMADRQLVRKIRSLDDPEILQRVLAGLLNLP